MGSITSPASKRTSNGLSTVPTNYGSRWTRIVGHTINAGYHLINAAADVVVAAAKSPITIAHFNAHASQAVIKYLSTDPTKTPYNPLSNIHTVKNTNGTGSKLKDTTTTPTPTPIQPDPDSTYRWNLPPHAWSLPVDPSQISNTVVSPSSDIHTKRRGLIFVGRKYDGNTVEIDPVTKKPIPNIARFTDNYGFQFMWNPETFTQNTSVNWGITPTQNDKTAWLTGLVAANSTLNFTLRLDRTNDFACFASKGIELKDLTSQELAINSATNQINSLTASYGIAPVPPVSGTLISEKFGLATYYSQGRAPASEQDFALNLDAKINDLIKRGTEADLEFLYKSINGDGYNVLGVNTSNISYLMPTIVRIDIGPQRLVGMIQSVDVNHLAFTREMVPIRTDVTLSIDLRAFTSYATSNFGANAAEIAATPTGLK